MYGYTIRGDNVYFTRAEWSFYDLVSRDCNSGFYTVPLDGGNSYQNRVMVNPFVQGHLRPDVVMTVAATFAPDSGSIVAAVLGDGGLWNESFFDILTFYQIRLDENSFEARKIYRTDLAEYDILWMVGSTVSMAWLDNHSLWLTAPSFTIAIREHLLVIPAAFERFVD